LTNWCGAAERDLDIGPVINPHSASGSSAISPSPAPTGCGSRRRAASLERPARRYYVKPTLIATCRRPCAAQEEIFGPVLVAIRVRDEDDALRVATARRTPGLRRLDRRCRRAMRLARRVHSGQVFINNYGRRGVNCRSAASSAAATAREGIHRPVRVRHHEDHRHPHG